MNQKEQGMRMQRCRSIYLTITTIAVVLAGAAPRSGALLAAGERTIGPDSSLVPVKVLESRRAALLELLDPGIAIVPSATTRADWEHAQDSHFRQDNNFYYLTGLETPGSWLVMFKEETGQGKALLYVPERDRGREIWNGRQPDADRETAERTGIDAVRPAAMFETDILSRLGESQDLGEFAQIYLPLGGDPSLTSTIVDVAVAGHRSISDLGKPLSSLRQVKDSVEIARLRRAAEITAQAQVAAMQAAHPGMHEYELEAIVEYVFRSRGAERVGFPSIVGSGPNSVILHHDRNRRRMEEGDLVVVDVGAEVGYYTADVTRTFPVSGEFSKRQRKIYELVLATQQLVIDSVRPGISILELERIARGFMRKRSACWRMLVSK